MLAIVTGASCGIGLETAKALASNSDYKGVILACRNKAKTELAISGWSDKCEIMVMDLSSLDSVEAFVNELKRTCEKVDTVVLNAGINNYTTPGGRKTIDGLDEIWQVNFIAHFYLVALLKPLMHAETSRVVALSSFMHWFASADRFVELAKPSWTGPCILNYYSDSKLAMTVFAHELNARKQVHAIAASPGAVATDIFRSWFNNGRFSQLARTVFNAPLLSCKDGSRTSVYACTMVLPKEFTYLSPYGQIKGRGRTLALLTDMYWFWAAGNPDRFVGECANVVRDPLVGASLWDLASAALGDRLTRISQ